MGLREDTDVWLGGDKHVLVSQIDRIVFSGPGPPTVEVIMKDGKCHRPTRRPYDLVRELQYARGLFSVRRKGRSSPPWSGPLGVMSVHEAAELTGLLPRELRKLIYQGKIDARKVGRRWAIDRWSFYLWFSEHG